ncbi:MAG: GGDEF domain-containing protein [Spirochaetales bacterium]|nr:GGDEF domain-containing protein [Spirochaetales bacterium]
MKLLTFVVILFNSLYLLQFRFFPGKENQSPYLSVYNILFVIFAVISLLFRLVLPLIESKASVKMRETLYFGFTLLIFYYCLSLSLLDMVISVDFSAYVIATFGLALFQQTSYRRTLLILCSGVLFFLAGLLLFTERSWEEGLIMPTFIFPLFAATIARGMWISKKNELLLTFELEEKNRELKDASLKDALTGLSNRRYLMDFISHEIAGYRRTGSPLSVLLIDVDHFKKINDSLGHAAGDRVLREIARILSDFSRERDLVVRYGGEEFLIVCPETGEENACLLGQRIRSAIEGTSFPDVPWTVTVTIGIGEITSRDDGNSLINRADQRLYMGKRQGRNLCVC